VLPVVSARRDELRRDGAFTVTEREGRERTVEYARLLWERGLVAGSSGNISLRLANMLLVTPTLRSLRALEPTDIVRVSFDGMPVDSDRRPSSELPLHLAAYRARPETRCVIHTHPTFTIAWSKLGRLFPLETVGAAESLGSIAFTPYAKPGSLELADLCAAAFASGATTVVMERHGLSSLGSNLEEAFIRTDLAEQTAAIETHACVLRSAGARRGSRAGRLSDP